MEINEKRVLKILTVVLLLGLVIGLGFYFFSSLKNFKGESESKKNISLPGPLRVKKEEKFGNVIDDEVIRITNEYRQQQGLPPLKENEKLNEAAMMRADDMFKRQYFDHVAPDGTDVTYTLSIVKYEYAASGENLALGYFKDSRDLVDAWMASEGHRENILKKNFTEIGVAHKIDIFEGKTQLIAVQVFAKPLSDCPMPDENLKKQIEDKKNYIESLKKQIETLDKEIATLKQKIESLVDEINQLYLESNELIKKGNQIYRETKDKSLAEKYWSEGEAKRNLADEKNKELNILQQELEAKVDYYNNLVGQIQKEQSLLENLILKYNSQVDSFNSCVKE